MTTSAKGFLVLVSIALSTAGCRDRIARTAADGGADPRGTTAEETLSQWFQVYSFPAGTGRSGRKLRGFVERRHEPFEDGGHFVVYPLDDPSRAMGFYLPSGKTYRYRTDRDGLVSEEVGMLEPHRAIQALLGIQDEEIELDPSVRPWLGG